MFKFFLLLVIMLTISCANIVKDPSLAYNKEFLSKYKMQIRKSKTKHKNIAKDSGIYYTDDATKQLVDPDYYTKAIRTKDKKNFTVKSEKYNTADVMNENMEFLPDNQSIYKSNSNLRENKLSSLKEDDGTVIYLEDNYGNYKTEKNFDKNIKIDNANLYGTLKERKKKFYYTVDSDELLISFDYIDLLSRVRTETYLKEKENEPKKTTIDSIKDKILNIFGGLKKK